MIAYPTKSLKLSGTNYKEVYKHAMSAFKKVKNRTKRKPYLRSAYFNKEKVFFDFFWLHLFQKREPERRNRLKYFQAAIDVIQNSRNHPESKDNPNNPSEIVHRFAGLAKDKDLFYIQIKEKKRTSKKQLMSIFPERD